MKRWVENHRLVAYKLFKVRKDGSIGSLFINASRKLPVGKWMWAEDYPTKGYAHRPGWHATSYPAAPHLSLKGRKWFKVELKHWSSFRRPISQGGVWFLAKRMKIIGEV